MMNLYPENLIACASDLTQGGGDAGNKERNKGK